jgi:hypothetical protein
VRCGRIAASEPTIAASIQVAALGARAPENRQSARGQKWQPCSGDKEDFIRVGALDLSAWGKATDVDIAGIRGMRAGDEPGLSGNRRSVRDISCRSRRRRFGSWAGRSILRGRFRCWGRRWSRSGGKLRLSGLSSLIAKSILCCRSVRAAFAPAFAGCKHNQECGGGHDPVRSFHGDSFFKNARLMDNLQCKSSVRPAGK